MRLENGEVVTEPYIPDHKAISPVKMDDNGDYVEAVWNEMEYIKNEKIDVLVCETTSLMDSTMEMFYGDKDAEIIGYPELPSKVILPPFDNSQNLFSKSCFSFSSMT